MATALALIGRVLVVGGLVHAPAAVLALGLGAWDDAAALVIGAATAVVVGRVLTWHLPATVELDAGTGMVVVASSWLLVPAVAATAFLLSGHLGSWTNAYFDAMSGLTTSGLTVLQDVDHLGPGMQLLRHSLHFAGGQGIILVMLTVLDSGHGGAGRLLVGEGREERLVPNVVRTARLIYLIAVSWLAIGTVVLWVTLMTAGLAPGRALLHAVVLFMAAFDTGGFSMMSTSVAYYHALSVELVLIVLMVAGALSFPVHYRLWRRRVGQVGRDLGLRTMVASTLVLTLVVLVGLAAHGTFDDPASLWRSGGFTALSASTGTGFAVVPGATLATWGQLAPAAIVTLMAFGAMAGSTAGGIKMERIAIMAKAAVRDVGRALAPPDAVVVTTHPSRFSGMPVRIPPAAIAAAGTITMLFVATYVGGALVLVAYGASLPDALFESVSATATVGLSVGVVGPDSPWLVKATVILQMWMGRLEFIAAFGLLGWLATLLRGSLVTGFARGGSRADPRS